MSGWNDKRRVILPYINKVKPLDKCSPGAFCEIIFKGSHLYCGLGRRQFGSIA